MGEKKQRNGHNCDKASGHETEQKPNREEKLETSSIRQQDVPPEPF